MNKITFVYCNNKKEIIFENKISLKDELIKFLSIINKNEKDIIFYIKGKKLDIYNNNENYLKKIKNGNIIISVIDLSLRKDIKDEKINILCPICKNLALIKENDNNNKISIYNCINNHKTDNLTIKDLFKNENNEIQCDLCSNKKYLCNNNIYICSCNKKICQLCISKHNIKGHNMIKYNERYYYCIEHKKEFISYCNKCKKNISEKCEYIHNKHEIILYKMEKPNQSKIEKKKDEIKNIIKMMKKMDKM